MATVALVGEVDPRDPASVARSLSDLVRLDLAYLRLHPSTPSLYASGVRYRRESPPPGGLRAVETWRTIPAVLAAGAGDCEDLACWRAAELRARGERARAWAVRSNTAGVLWHVVVRRENGSMEDPSRRLGM